MLFSFRHLPVLSLEDVTADLEQLQPFLGAIPEEALSPAVKEALAKITPGPWTALVLTAKIEEGAGFQTVRVRTEGGGTTARLRGLPKVKAGQEVKAAEVFATVPVGFRPPATVVLTGASGGAFNIFQINAAGQIIPEKTIAAGNGIVFDGLTYNLT